MGLFDMGGGGSSGGSSSSSSTTKSQITGPIAPSPFETNAWDRQRAVEDWMLQSMGFQFTPDQTFAGGVPGSGQGLYKNQGYPYPGNVPPGGYTGGPLPSEQAGGGTGTGMMPPSGAPGTPGTGYPYTAPPASQTQINKKTGLPKLDKAGNPKVKGGTPYQPPPGTVYQGYGGLPPEVLGLTGKKLNKAIKKGDVIPRENIPGGVSIQPIAGGLFDTQNQISNDVDTGIANQVSSENNQLSITPEQRALIEQVYGAQRSAGQEQLDRYASQLAGARGMMVSDSPIGNELLRRKAAMEEQLGGSQAQATLGYGQFQQQFQESRRQFQSQLKQQSLLNRMAMGQQALGLGEFLLGNRYGLGPATKKSKTTGTSTGGGGGGSAAGGGGGMGGLGGFLNGAGSILKSNVGSSTTTAGGGLGSAGVGEGFSGFSGFGIG